MLHKLASWFRYPAESDTAKVSAMVAAQWAGIYRRTPTYAHGYQDRPGSQDRSQRRAEWIAAQAPVASWGDVLEVGCGMGRNLAAIARQPQPREIKCQIKGLDICPEAIQAAQKILPAGQFRVANLLEPITLPIASVVLTVGVLCHLPPATLLEVLRRLLGAACYHLVMVEEEGRDEIVKGPPSWHPERVTDDYCLWRPNLVDRLGDLGVSNILVTPVPQELQAPGAMRMLAVQK